MNLPPTIPLLVESYDPELIDFFDGWEYRYDILKMIDRNVDDLARKHEHGLNLAQAEYKMMCFGIYANPVDAYKYYEYNYQDSFLVLLPSYPNTVHFTDLFRLIAISLSMVTK